MTTPDSLVDQLHVLTDSIINALEEGEISSNKFDILLTDVNDLLQSIKAAIDDADNQQNQPLVQAVPQAFLPFKHKYYPKSTKYPY